MILRAEQVTFTYGAGDSVLSDVSMELRCGLVTGLFGPNGSGKSTLLRCLNGSLKPLSGQVFLDQRSVASMSPQEIARDIAVVPQDTPSDIPFTVRQMVTLGRYAHGITWGQESTEDLRIAGECMERLGIAHLSQRPFGHLSGGERQRVVIARALAQEARFLLLDEPATYLDIAHQLDLCRLVRGLAGEGYGVLMVTHDVLVAPMFVGRAHLLCAGRTYAVGPVAEVLTADNIAAVFGSRVQVSWSTDVGTRDTQESEPYTNL